MLQVEYGCRAGAYTKYAGISVYAELGLDVVPADGVSAALK